MDGAPAGRAAMGSRSGPPDAGRAIVPSAVDRAAVRGGDLVIGELLVAAAEQSIDAYGPFSEGEAVETAVRVVTERADGRVVALPTADPLLEALQLRTALGKAGAQLLEPDDPAWSELLGASGVGVTGATLAVAATATLLMPCGVGRPRGTHIVPPAHVCLLRTDAIVATLGDALEASARGGLPSNLSWVSGPSRTADLEMRRTLGVHGPKSVDLILIGS
jgi:L-lactate dehydrogenase complex protein LldG